MLSKNKSHALYARGLPLLPYKVLTCLPNDGFYGKNYEIQLNFGKHVQYNTCLSRLLSVVSDYHAYDAV